MEVRERIKALQNQMKEHNIDVYYVPTADNHQSEYVSDHFKTRVFLSGFTGSAGTLIVTAAMAGLWTDGRYFIQAERQLADSGITLFRMGEEGVLTELEFIQQQLPEKGTLAFDGKVVSTSFALQLEQLVQKKQGYLQYEQDLVQPIWENRPALSKNPVYFLDLKYSGESMMSKLNRVREQMKQANCDCHLLTSLDDIAWLLNIRGNDVACNPVVLSYCIVLMDEVHLYLDETKLNKEQRLELQQNHVVVHPYDAIYEDIKKWNTRILYDPNKVNYALYKNGKGEFVSQANPEVMMKAIKNETEVENLRLCHIKDGLAVTKFIYWLKHQIKEQSLSEWDATEYLQQCRKQNAHYLGDSFQAIGAYNANAAMMHYSASKASASMMEAKGFYLIDSGGQYYEGTTDITRTICLGEIPQEWKIHYTQVLRGVIGLSKAKFLYGCRGINLDILARGPLWNLGIDYKCGTGHGVGYLLNVHEAPNGFRWKIVPERNDSCVLEEGMVTTVEPGVYMEQSHGIRIENELLCQKREKNEYGQFMGFETLTMAPIDLDAIEPSLMTQDELDFLNEYHQRVYETLRPMLNEKERVWLKEATRKMTHAG
ncbi:MAG: aminopeptidase P family protein [Erysipelotrichaceae bacterium]|nr:aminopeptidase P family protein [Erysipelotrichaceae bacterium]